MAAPIDPLTGATPSPSADENNQQEHGFEEVYENVNVDEIDTSHLELSATMNTTNAKLLDQVGGAQRSEKNAIPEIQDISAYIEQVKGTSTEKNSQQYLAMDGTDLSKLANVYAIVPHAKGDHKIVYLRNQVPSDIIDDPKHRTKGSTYSKDGEAIYQVHVDMKQHGNLHTTSGKPVDVWIIDTPADLDEQIQSIYAGKGGGTNFGLPIVSRENNKSSKSSEADDLSLIDKIDHEKGTQNDKSSKDTSNSKKTAATTLPKEKKSLDVDSEGNKKEKTTSQKKETPQETSNQKNITATNKKQEVNTTDAQKEAKEKSTKNNDALGTNDTSPQKETEKSGDDAREEMKKKIYGTTTPNTSTEPLPPPTIPPVVTSDATLTKENIQEKKATPNTSQNNKAGTEKKNEGQQNTTQPTTPIGKEQKTVKTATTSTSGKGPLTSTENSNVSKENKKITPNKSSEGKKSTMPVSTQPKEAVSTNSSQPLEATSNNKESKKEDIQERKPIPPIGENSKEKPMQPLPEISQPSPDIISDVTPTLANDTVQSMEVISQEEKTIDSSTPLSHQAENESSKKTTPQPPETVPEKSSPGEVTPTSYEEELTAPKPYPVFSMDAFNETPPTKAPTKIEEPEKPTIPPVISESAAEGPIDKKKQFTLEQILEKKQAGEIQQVLETPTVVPTTTETAKKHATYPYHKTEKSLLKIAPKWKILILVLLIAVVARIAWVMFSGGTTTVPSNNIDDPLLTGSLVDTGSSDIGTGQIDDIDDTQQPDDATDIENEQNNQPEDSPDESQNTDTNQPQETYTMAELVEKLEAQQTEARSLVNQARQLKKQDAIKFAVAALQKAATTLEEIEQNPNLTADQVLIDTTRADLYIQNAIDLLR